MSTHLHMATVTRHGLAANNRGENEGNMTTLQKIIYKGQTHTTVSSEAVRWSMRYGWQESGFETNRTWNGSDNKIKDENFAEWQKFIDDDVLGFMNASAAASEGETSDVENSELENIEPPSGDSSGKKTKKSKPKGTNINRKGALGVSRSVSLTPFMGETSFGARSGSFETKDNKSLYGTELHSTRYQTGYSITPKQLAKSSRVLDVIDSIIGLGQVGGNHARYLYDYSPESIVFRITDDMSPRILNCFIENNNEVDIPDILRQVKSGDIKSDELIIGGPVRYSSAGKELEKLGVQMFDGVRATADAAKTKLENCEDIKNKIGK